MDNKLGVGLIVGSLALVLSLSGNVYQRMANKQDTIQISKVQKQNKTISKQLKEARKQKSLLAGQVDSLKTNANNSGKSTGEIDFSNVTKKFFDVMQNFKPKTYGQRKDKVKSLISDDLYKQYFSNSGTYGDSNSVSSKLDELTIYTQSQQGSNIKGLAVVTFESKSGNADNWTKSTVVYQLEFDTTTNRITNIQNLGTSFKAGDLD